MPGRANISDAKQPGLRRPVSWLDKIRSRNDFFLWSKIALICMSPALFIALTGWAREPFTTLAIILLFGGLSAKLMLVGLSIYDWLSGRPDSLD